MKAHLNLLPWSCRKRGLIRARLWQWSLPWGAALAAALAVGAVEWSGGRTARARADRLEEAYLPVVRLRAEIKAEQAKRADLVRQESMWRELEGPRPALGLLGLVSRSAAGCAGRLRVEQVIARPAAESEKAGSAEATAAIKGVASDNLAVARFVVALRQAAAFDRVDLKASEEKLAGKRTYRSFTVECAY